MQTATKKPKIFFSIASAAKATGYSKRHLRRLFEEQDIEPIIIGRSFFFLHKDIEFIKALPKSYQLQRYHP
jgi:hypothetical protein